LASKYDPPFAPKNVPPRPPQVFEVKHLFSAGMVQSRIQISGPVGSNFGANQHAALPSFFWQCHGLGRVAHLKLEVTGGRDPNYENDFSGEP
jgi:hypothetical protein